MEYETGPLAEEEESLVEEKISAYAYSVAPPEPGTPEEGQLVFKAEADGRIIAGCIVNIHTWGRAVLAVLWVDERYRGQGLGSMLIRRAEHAAGEKGCTFMCLGTTDFQARGLYEKHGYRVFTVNRNVPRGHESYSLSKRIDRGIPDYVPKNSSAGERFAILCGSREDAEIIEAGLDRYCGQFVRGQHGYIPISRKLAGEDGRMIAGIVAGIDGDNTGFVSGLWVEEPYRGMGLGSALLFEAEREAAENGAYIMLTNACDWNAGFFRKCGYTVRGVLEDYPRGHRAFEIQKLLGSGQ